MERFLYFLFALGILYACSIESFFGDIHIGNRFSEVDHRNTKVMENVQALENNCSSSNNAFTDNSSSIE